MLPKRIFTVGLVSLGWASFWRAAEGQTLELGVLSFEVASVKPSGLLGGTALRGGPRTADPGQITIKGVDLRTILMRAYELTDEVQISGPGWLEEERFDITAKVPSGATKDEADRMLQNLLNNRFRIVLHHETRQLQSYELAVGRQGPKLKVSERTISPAVGQESTGDLRTPDKDGFPRVPPGRVYMTSIRVEGRNRSRFGLTSMTEFAGFLARETGRPVADKTGLAGQYDFTLEHSPEGLGGQHYIRPEAIQSQAPPPANEGGLSLFGAVEQQLGLRLDSKKAPFDVLVIDRLDKTPTGN